MEYFSNSLKILCLLFFLAPTNSLRAEELLEARFINALYPGFSAKLAAESKAYINLPTRKDLWVFHSIKIAFAQQVLEQYPTSFDDCHRVYGNKIKDFLAAASQNVDARLSPSSHEQRALLIFIQAIGDCSQTSSDPMLYKNQLNIAAEFCRQSTGNTCWQLYSLLAGEKPDETSPTASLPQQITNILSVMKDNPLGTVVLFVSIKLLGYLASYVICPRLGFL